MKRRTRNAVKRLPFVRKCYLKSRINKLVMKIEEVERRRKRSEVSLMNSFLTGEEPDPEDKKYFYQYSEMIDSYREEIRRIQKIIDRSPV